jgi:large subunit ribosomal protein L25
MYAGGKPATALQVDPDDVVRVLSGPYRRNALIDLDVEGTGPRLVMATDVKVDPVRRTPQHVDFLEIAGHRPLVVSVPVTTTGKAKGVVAGGRLTIAARALSVRCLPEHIPEKIVVDVTELDFGARHGAEIPMPAGCALVDDPGVTVVTVTMPRGEMEEEKPAAAVSAEVATVEGEKAAADAGAKEEPAADEGKGHKDKGKGHKDKGGKGKK